MSSLSQSDFDAMKQRTERARNPEHFAAVEAAKREKWQAGKERELQDAIQSYAETHMGCYVLRPRMDKKSTLPEGYPDLTIMRGGKVALIEAKASGGIISDAQRECLAQLRMVGNPAVVCYNLKEAIDFLQSNL